MTNLTITTLDLGSVILKEGEFRDELLTFSGAGTVLAGTILARKAVDDAITPVADVGNTGDGTCTVASVAAGSVVPLVGAYNLEVIEAVVNGGILKLVDPNGAQVGTNLIMTVGAGAATIFEVAGLLFTVTDGATDFIVGDKFSLPVVANGKMVPYAIAGAGGAQIPKGIVTYDVVAAGAGDEAIREMVSGSVRKERLIIDADGDGSNITDAILDELRSYTLVSIDVSELNIYDNQ